MKWIGADSTNIAAYAWQDVDGGRLWVRFLKSGKTGYYSPCPESVFLAMQRAESQGVFQANNLRKGPYVWTYADPPPR